MSLGKITLLSALCFVTATNADISISQNQAGVYRQCIKNGDIAIAFDDGPATNTEAVLDVLKAKGVHATFFINGDLYEHIDNPATLARLRRINQEGHQIGSHTWSHIDLTAGQSVETIRREMLDLENKVKDILGFKMTIMRPPYGSINDTVLNIIHGEMNYSVILWNLDSLDWSNGGNTSNSMEVYVNAMQNSSSLNSSFIVLQHDPIVRSSLLTSEVIDYAREKGYNPVTISQCIGIPDSDNNGSDNDNNGPDNDNNGPDNDNNGPDNDNNGPDNDNNGAATLTNSNGAAKLLSLILFAFSQLYVLRIS